MGKVGAYFRFMLVCFLTDDVVTFVRNATMVDPVVVAINANEGKAGSLVFGEYSVGEVGWL